MALSARNNHGIDATNERHLHARSSPEHWLSTQQIQHRRYFCGVKLAGNDNNTQSTLKQHVRHSEILYSKGSLPCIGSASLPEFCITSAKPVAPSSRSVRITKDTMDMQTQSMCKCEYKSAVAWCQKGESCLEAVANRAFEVEPNRSW